MGFKPQYHGVRIHNGSILLPRINKLHSKNPSIIGKDRAVSAVAILFGCYSGAPTVSRNSVCPVRSERNSARIHSSHSTTSLGICLHGYERFS